ncbi:aldose epimerase family protein [Pseudoduganella sp. RAF19]|uniref:aldose epimerase family protein n=1 Tax=Pseudoduganella sp. RAF19 TaxID=3233052 RepID=UPI003F9555BF
MTTTSISAAIAATAAAAALAASSAAASGIRAEPYGVTPAGAAVERVTLSNDRGMQLSFIDYGAILVSATVADRHGKRANIMLGAPDLATYMRSNRRYGAVIGRYAGRIGNAQFTLDGKAYQLTPNSKGVAIHGDPNGIDRRVWARTDFADSESIGSTYRLVSPDGDQGMPGRMELAVTYRLLRHRDEFRIEYLARSDAPTVVNLTNHAYFNLAGAGAQGLASHRFRIDADRYIAADGKKLPTGELPSVAGTPLDFRRPASAAARLAEAAASAGTGQGGLLGTPPGYDHGLVFNKPAGALARVAVIDESTSGRRMEVSTTEPSAQLYTANSFDGSEMGGEGRAYERYDGFAFETQHFADSPNKPQFPSTVLRPGQEFRSVTVFRFGLAP